MKLVSKYIILTADWHLRETIPICRTDNYIENQWKKVLFVKKLQEKYNAIVLHAGDVFDYWKPSPWLLSKTIENIPEQFYTIYGNHDLPQHSMNLVEKSGVYTLYKAGKINLLTNSPSWEQSVEDFDEKPFFVNTTKILVTHRMTYLDKKPYPDCNEPKGVFLLKKFKTYGIILTGHNHQSFTCKLFDRILVNPGSLMRMEVDQIDHKPCVYLWNLHSKQLTKIELPVENNVISKLHLDNKKNKEQEIQAFINSLTNDWKSELSFEKNIETFLQKNPTSANVKQIIYKSLEL